jgi:hypothetical protein
MFVLSITGFTAPCSVPPSDVRSFWYSIKTSAVVLGSIEVAFFLAVDVSAAPGRESVSKLVTVLAHVPAVTRAARHGSEETLSWA